VIPHRAHRRTIVSGLIGFVLVLTISIFSDETHRSYILGLRRQTTSVSEEDRQTQLEQLRAQRVAVHQSVEPVTKGSARLPQIHFAPPTEEELAGFPAFHYAMHPVPQVPNWGAMRTPAQWNRRYENMAESDFVPVPLYDLAVLTTPTSDLLQNRTQHTAELTAKLYYSTRHFGTYNLDAGEFTGSHPGVDLKLPQGTPIGSMGGGRVLAVRQDQNMGLYLLIEHRLEGEGIYYSLYGHLGEALVSKGDAVQPGQIIGTVGMTGKTTAPHLHFQIDRGEPGQHERFWPPRALTASEADHYTINPITFAANHDATRYARL